MRGLLLRTLVTLERVLKVDLRYLAKGLTYLASGQVVLAGLAMLSAIAFANLLPPEIFGQYRFVLSLVGILSLSILTGLDTAFFRAASRGYENTISLVVKRRALFGLFGSIAALGVAAYYYMNGNIVLALAFIIAALFIPIKDTFTFYSVLLNARGKFGRSTVYRIAVRVVTLVASIGAIALTDNLLVLLTVLFLSTTAAHYILNRKTISDTPPTGPVDREAMGYAYHLSFLGSLGSVTGNLYNIALFHFLGAAAVAQFYFAIAPAEQLRGLISQIETLLFPRFAKDNWHQSSFLSFVKKIFPFLLVLLAIVGIYVLVAPYLFRLFFPQYTDAVFLSQLYMPITLVTAINTVLSTIVKSKGMVRLQYALNISSSIFSFVVVIPLIAFYGLLGLVGGILLQKLLQTTWISFSLFVQNDKHSLTRDWI